MATYQDIHNLQAEVARRCAKANINVRFSSETRIPYATSDGVVFPSLTLPMTDQQLSDLRTAAIHEPLHVQRPEMFEIMKKECLPLDHPLAQLSNAFEDDVMERIHCKEYAGDYLDLARRYYETMASDIDKGVQTVEPELDEMKWKAGRLSYYKSRSLWDKVGGSLADDVIAVQHPATLEWFNKLNGAGIPEMLQHITTPHEVRDVAKAAYSILYPDKDIEEEIKQAQGDKQKAEDGAGEEGSSEKTKGKGKKGKKGDKEVEASPSGGKISWRDLAVSNHIDEDEEAGTASIDWEGKYQMGAWKPTTPDMIKEQQLPDGNQNYFTGDSVDDASVANQVRRAIQSKIRSTIIPERKSGKVNARALYRLGIPIVGDGDWNSRIFRRKTDVDELNTAITVLIDWSGSMGDGQKRPLAAKAAARLNYLFDTVLHTPVELLAFTTGHGLRHFIVKDFNSRATSAQIGERLSWAVSKAGGNADADALLWAASRLMKRREKRKVLIVLSDGSPSYAFNCGDADAALNAVTKELSRIPSLDLHGVGIEDDNVKRYYGDKALVLRNASELNRVLLTTLEECVVKHLGS